MLRFAQRFVCAVLRRNENVAICRASTRHRHIRIFCSVLCEIAMEEVLLWSIFAMCIVKKKRLEHLRSTRRSKWSRKWLLKRQHFSHIKLLRELRDERNDWRNYLRMDIDTYTYLLELVTPHINKENTCMRTAISAHERLTATLRFLATGRSYKDLEFTAYLFILANSFRYTLLNEFIFFTTVSRFAVTSISLNLLAKISYASAFLSLSLYSFDFTRQMHGKLSYRAIKSVKNSLEHCRRSAIVARRIETE